MDDFVDFEKMAKNEKFTHKVNRPIGTIGECSLGAFQQMVVSIGLGILNLLGQILHPTLGTVVISLEYQPAQSFRLLGVEPIPLQQDTHEGCTKTDKHQFQLFGEWVAGYLTYKERSICQVSHQLY